MNLFMNGSTPRKPGKFRAVPRPAPAPAPGSRLQGVSHQPGPQLRPRRICQLRNWLVFEYEDENEDEDEDDR